MYIMGIFGNKLKKKELQQQYDMWNAEFNESKRQYEQNRADELSYFNKEMDWARQQLRLSQNFSQRMLEAEQAYNTEMFNMTNAYNTPSAQRSRLVAAGLNPFMMMNGGSAGQATSLQSPSAPSASPGSSPSGGSVGSSPMPGIPQLPVMNWENTIGGILKGLMDNLFQLQSRRTQSDVATETAKGMAIDNKYKEAMNIANLLEKKADVRSKEAKSALDEQAHDFKAATFSFDVDKSRYDSMNAEAQNQVLLSTVALQRSQAAINSANLKWIDKEKAASLALTYSTVALQSAQKGLTYEQMLTEATKRQLNVSLSKSADSKAMYDIKAAYNLMSPAQARRFNKALITEKEYESIRASSNIGPDNIFQSIASPLFHYLGRNSPNNPLNY